MHPPKKYIRNIWLVFIIKILARYSNPCYSRGSYQEDHSLRPVPGKNVRPYWKNNYSKKRIVGHDSSGRTHS
jgi:hypothetical protein